MPGSDVMPLPADTRSAANALSEELRTVASAIVGTQVASHQSSSVPGWVGDSADAYTDSILTLGQHARELAESFSPASSALATWADALGTAITSTIPALWERYDEASAEYAHTIASVNAEAESLSSSASPMSKLELERRVENAASERDCVQADVLREYRTTLEKLDTEALYAALALIAAQNTVIDDSHCTSRAQIGAQLFNDIPLVDGQAEWEYAQTIVPEMARYLNTEFPKGKQLEDFAQRYADLLSNPFIARALSERVSAEQFLAFSAHVASYPLVEESTRHSLLLALGAASVLAMGGINTSDPQTATSFASALGGLTTEKGLALHEHTRHYVESLKQAGRTPFHLHQTTLDQPSPTAVFGYEILCQTMGMAGAANTNLALGPAFFEEPTNGRSLAQDIVAWDAENPRWKSFQGYEDELHLFHDPASTTMLDPMHAMYTLMDRPTNLDLEKAAHPLLDAERQRLDAVQSFLASDTPEGMDVNHDGIVDESDHPRNMTRYLTGGRTASGSNSYYGFQDGGEQFGRVLDQASKPEPFPRETVCDGEENRREWQDRDARAARIAANFMFGYQDALDINHDHTLFSATDQVNGQNIFGYTNAPLRSWAGSILAPHVAGIAQSFETVYATDGIALSTDGHNHITFNSAMRDRLLGKHGFFTDLGFDAPELDDNGTPDDKRDDFYKGGRAPAIDTLRLAAASGFHTSLNGTISGDSRLSIDEVIDTWSPLMEALFTAPSDATSQALDALNARNEHWKDLIGDGIGAMPAKGWIKYAVDNSVTNKLVDNILPTNQNNNTERIKSEDLVAEYMKDSLCQQISTSDTFKSFLSSQRESDSAQIAALTEANGEVLPYDQMSPEKRTAFRKYVTESGSALGFGEAYNHITSSVNNARLQHGNSRIIRGD